MEDLKEVEVKYIIGIKEMAKYLGCSQRPLYRLMRNGKIPPPAQSVSGRRIWTADQLEEMRKLIYKFAGNPNLGNIEHGIPPRKATE